MRKRTEKTARALLALASTLLAAALPANAEGGTAPNHASGRVEFRILIPTVLRVNAVAQPASLQVEAHHIGQGYVDVDGATLVRITSNSRQGIDLAVALDATVVQRAVVRLLGREVNAEGSGTVNRIDAGRLDGQPVAVSYRLYLEPGVTPGSYRWPVGLRFSPTAA